MRSRLAGSHQPANGGGGDAEGGRHSMVQTAGSRTPQQKRITNAGECKECTFNLNWLRAIKGPPTGGMDVVPPQKKGGHSFAPLSFAALVCRSRSDSCMLSGT